MLLQFFLLATTVAVFLAYRVSGAPALRLMGLAGGLLLFRALPEFLGSVMVILFFVWAWARIHTVDYGRFMRARPALLSAIGLAGPGDRQWQPPPVRLRRSIGASAAYVCGGLVLAYVAPRSRDLGLGLCGVGIAILSAHVVYF